MTTTETRRDVPPTRYDIPRLERLRKTIASAPEAHNQGQWGRYLGTVEETYKNAYGATAALVSCPSSACAAGWTVVNEKAKMLMSINNKGSVDDTATSCLTAAGEIREISNYAAELLGLISRERDVLFHATPTTKETLARIDQIIVAAKHGRTWDKQRRLQGLPPLNELPSL